MIIVPIKKPFGKPISMESRDSQIRNNQSLDFRQANIKYVEIFLRFCWPMCQGRHRFLYEIIFLAKQVRRRMRKDRVGYDGIMGSNFSNMLLFIHD